VAGGELPCVALFMDMRVLCLMRRAGDAPMGAVMCPRRSMRRVDRRRSRRSLSATFISWMTGWRSFSSVLCFIRNMRGKLLP